MEHIHIVKRRKGHGEPYDNHKVYASCYAACLNANCTKEKAEQVCDKVMHNIDRLVEGRRSITSQDIFEEIAHAMKSYHKEAAFMYETHRDIS